MNNRWDEMLARPTFVQVRTAALFMGGLLGVAYVTLTSQADRPTLLILFAAMMGLPLFLRADDKLHLPPGMAPPPGVPPPVPPPPTEPAARE
jgi:hypothetical protein